MSFASPWFLVGLLTVAIPVYLHLFFKKKPIRKDFSSLKLIKLSVDFIARKQKIKNLILLALRIMLVTLVVMALARPYWGRGASAGATGTPAAFVVLLDNSMTMGASHQGISVFSNAKSRALEIVDQMQPGDRATVGVINDPGSLSFSQLTWDKNALKRSLDNTKLSIGATDPASSLIPALELLAPLGAYRRSVYVVTDMNKASWKSFLQRYDLERVDPAIDLVMVPVGRDAPENMAITSFDVNVPMVMTGTKTPFSVELANYSPRNQTARVSLSVNSERKSVTEIEMQADSKREVIIETSFNTSGLTHVEVSIQADALLADNVRHLAIRVFDPCPVLVVRSPGSDDRAREALFVESALNPFRGLQNNFIVDSRSAQELRNVQLENYKAVILINQRTLEKEFIDRLAQYVMTGGNLITFLGNQVRPDWYNENLLDDLGSSYLMPARIFHRVGNAVSKSVAYQLTDLDMGHPAFDIFRPEGSGDPSRARIYEFFQVRPNSSAMLLARMSRGLPAIVEERRGLGRSMLVTFSADTSWSNWPLRATWVPFLHQTLISMVTQSEVDFGEVRPSATVSATISARNIESLALKLPDGSTRTIDTNVAGQGMIHFNTRETSLGGYYEILADNKPISAFVVNPPSDESNLTRIQMRDVPRFIPLRHDPSRGHTLKSEVSRLRTGYELGGVALLLLLLLALVESWFANKDKPQKDGLSL